MNFARLFPRRPHTGIRSLFLVGLLLAALRLNAAMPAPGATIPLNEIGTAAQKQYHGDGLAIRPEAGGAALRCVFQKLEGQATGQGLWLRSTADKGAGTPFRVVAQSVERTGSASGALESSGQVETGMGSARFVRPGLVEEYSVSAEGVRQDFVVTRRPEGKGTLQVDLSVEGAAAEAESGGVRLMLADSGRKLAYHRLKVSDAQGRALSAHMAVKSAGRIEVTVDDAAAAYPIRIDPTFTDANWISLGALLGLDGAVKAAVTDSAGNLYVGGAFSIAGSVMAENIARWDGTNWFALGSGIHGTVYTLAVDSNGVLYAGGDFIFAGGNYTPYIAQWDGSAWSDVGGGMDDTVYALAADTAGNVYAGGFFATAGATPVNFIAQWDGTTWTDMGGGMDAPALSLATDGLTVYAGGGFSAAGGVPANYIARWDGGGWSPLGDGLDDAVLAMAVDGSGNLFASGAFLEAGSVTANSIARWDGTNWMALGDGVDSVVFSLALDGAGGLYAGGFFDNAGAVAASRVAHWDGTNWLALGSGVDSHVPNAVYALAVTASGTLFAGGDFLDIGGVTVGGVGQWDGTAWSALGSGADNSIYALVADGGGNVYAGGAFTSLGGVSAGHVAKWDGASWSALGTGLDGPVYALLLDGSGNLYVGGDFFTAGGTTNANSVAKWDGAAWSTLGGGMDMPVYALARDSANNIYAGGDFANADGNLASYVAKWDGTAWSALGAGVDDTVNALVVDATDNLYAGGYFSMAGGNSANYVAKWDGTNWNALSQGADGVVFTLAFDASGNLYAGGYFPSVDGTSVSAKNIAKWDGSAWAALGDGTDGAVYALTVDAVGNLYAAGYFVTAGTNTVYGIAKWDGADWSALGSGLDGGALALAVNSAGDLYVGGDFIVAGDKVSAFVARFVLNFAGIAVLNDVTPLIDGVNGVDFGIIQYGSNNLQVFSITNSGTIALTGIAFVKDGATPNDFTVDTSGTLTTLAPGDSTSFAVVFSPLGGGDRQAGLHITSNAVGESNPFDINLTGTGDVGTVTIGLDNTSVDENAPAGTVVGTLSAADLAPGDTFTFSLHCGCFDNNLFRIVGNQLVTRGPFDYEAQSSYIVIVHAENAAGYSADQSFGININDLNEPPVFSGYSFTALKDTPATINWNKVLVRVSDPDFGGQINLNTIDTASAQGGVVQLVSNAIKYTPPAGYVGSDSFTITFDDDPYSASVVATINITVNEGPAGQGATSLSVTAVGSDVELTFAGIPGTHYLLQRSEALVAPLAWTTLTNITANANGVVIYTDPSPPSPSYWRTIIAP